MRYKRPVDGPRIVSRAASDAVPGTGRSVIWTHTGTAGSSAALARRPTAGACTGRRPFRRGWRRHVVDGWRRRARPFASCAAASKTTSREQIPPHPLAQPQRVARRRQRLPRDRRGARARARGLRCRHGRAFGDRRPVRARRGAAPRGRRRLRRRDPARRARPRRGQALAAGRPAAQGRSAGRRRVGAHARAPRGRRAHPRGPALEPHAAHDRAPPPRAHGRRAATRRACAAPTSPPRRASWAPATPMPR